MEGMVAPNPMTADDLKERTKGFGRSLEITFGDDLSGNKHLGKLYLPFLFQETWESVVIYVVVSKIFYFHPYLGK